MERVIFAIILSSWVMFMGIISYGLGDYKYPLETLIISFSLPIWSIMTIGLWYDTGRLLIGSTIDNVKSMTPNWIRAISFIVWMSIILTYIIYVHIDIQAVQMLITIPILSIPLREWLLRDWSSINIQSKREISTLLTWGIGSYLTYWLITFAWIIIRVYVYDATGEGFVFYIQ